MLFISEILFIKPVKSLSSILYDSFTIILRRLINQPLFNSLSLNDDKTQSAGSIKFGATVTVVDEDTDEEKTWQIVGEHEANIEKGLLNVKSPIARALIGKDAGDSVEVRTPGGEKSYEVLSVNYT